MSTIEAPVAPISQEPQTRPPLRASLRLKLASFVAALVILTAVLVIASVSYFTRQMLLEEITDHLSVMASDRGAVVREYINRQLGQAEQIASRTRLRLLVAEHADGQPPRIASSKSSTRSSSTLARSATPSSPSRSTSPDGTLLVSTNEDEPSPHSPRPTRLPNVPEWPLHRATSRSSKTGSLRTSVSAPLLNRREEVFGILIARIDASPLMLVLKNLVGLRQTGEILIAPSRQGRIHYLLPDRQGRASPDVPPELDRAMVRRHRR